MALLPTSALPDAQEGIIQDIVLLLQQILSRLPQTDPATGRLRTLIEAFTATNASVNVNQFGGQAVNIGTGVASTGTPRVTPSSDTLAGVAPGPVNGNTMGQDWNRAGLQAIYTNTQTS